MARPPSTKLGRTSTGYPISAAARTPSSMFVTAQPLGCGISRSSRIFSKLSRFSARSMAAQSVPMIRTPRSMSGWARLMAVCPPSDAMTPSGCSKSRIAITSSGVSGSKYSLSPVV